jgi:hypothetical protein
MPFHVLLPPPTVISPPPPPKCASGKYTNTSGLILAISPPNAGAFAIAKAWTIVAKRPKLRPHYTKSSNKMKAADNESDHSDDEFRVNFRKKPIKSLTSLLDFSIFLYIRSKYFLPVFVPLRIK